MQWISILNFDLCNRGRERDRKRERNSQHNKPTNIPEKASSNPTMSETQSVFNSVSEHSEMEELEKDMSLLSLRRVRFERQGNYATPYAHDCAQHVARMEARRERKREQRRALLEEKRRRLTEEPPRILVDELDMAEFSQVNYAGSLSDRMVPYPLELTMFHMDMWPRPTVEFCQVTRRPYIIQGGRKIFL